MLNFIITYWVEILFTGIIGVVGFLWRSLITYFKQLEATKEGVRLLLRCEIIHHFYTYQQAKKITIFEKQMIDDLYQEYQQFDHDQVIEDIMKRITEIPITNPEGGG